MRLIKENDQNDWHLIQAVPRIEDFQRNLATANTMLWWLRSHPAIFSRALGLASNQLGLEGRVILVRNTTTKGFKVLINPRVGIVEYRKGAERNLESCLSVKGDYKVDRWNSIHVVHEVINLEDAEESNPVKKELLQANGGLAFVIQHEIDHLNGILISKSTTSFYYKKNR